VLIVDYWASWCTPCLQELPHLQQLFESRGPRGLTVLAINVDEDGPTATASAKRLGLTMPIALSDTEFFKKLGVQKLRLPSTLVVDREGRMRGRWNGYRTGDEKDIAELVDALLSPEGKNTGRSIADVVTGAGVLKALWSRDLRGSADGVVAFPASSSAIRAVASAGGAITSFSADGSTLAQRPSASWAGRLLEFGAAADGSRRIVAFRPGGQTLGIVALPSNDATELPVAAPIVDAAVGSGRIAVLTTTGAWVADGTGAPAARVQGTEGLRDVVSPAGEAVVALRADGTIGTLETPGSWPSKAGDAARLLVARADGVLVGPRTAVAAAYGRFLPGNGHQVAVATYAGHLVLLDAADGKLLFDAAWGDLHDLAAADLDGDGFDELLVAAGHSVAALTKH
jgi:thiol-disulfide isomerase/thioredoxin